MNTAILQKCVDELKKEQPDIRYILGILETVIDISDGVIVPRETVIAERRTGLAIKPLMPDSLLVDNPPIEEPLSPAAAAYIHGTEIGGIS